jgi:UDP-N-acetylglucosamine--N-acetylmuramyl-(pentapeptide) pyrophosphoryl-undecaprenol N-acetylglucosamine transferase
LQAFPGVFKQAITTGNPVRKAICEIEKPENRAAQSQAQGKAGLRLLVIGGSLGAVKLNELIPQALAKIESGLRPEVIHQTGFNNIESARSFYIEAGVEAKVEAFIDDMPSVYEWADLVICRSGAMTVFELAAAGIASILVPYPYAVDDHQTFNAYYLERAGAAVIKQQDELTADWLVKVINDFSANRNKLLDMATAARKLAIPDSAKNIADACLNAGGVV